MTEHLLVKIDKPCPITKFISLLIVALVLVLPAINTSHWPCFHCRAKGGHASACQGQSHFLSLPGLDRALLVLPLGQRPGSSPKENLGQKRPTGARGVFMNNGGVTQRLESVSAADYIIKLTAITPALKTFFLYFELKTIVQTVASV